MTRTQWLPLILVLALPLAALAQPVAPEIPPGYYLEDDMILPLAEGSLTTNNPLWPGGIVPYEFDANVNATNQAKALTAMAEWEAVAAVTFVLRTTETAYIHIQDATSCSSQVGMTGSVQNINMACWNDKYKIAHEFCHALGFYHEQSRPDRDTYVTINTANIVSTCGSNGTSSCAGNFSLQSSAIPIGAYDFESIMHYGQSAFGQGSITITCNPPYTAFQSIIGQREHLSLGDATSMQFAYGPAPAPSISTLSVTEVGVGSANVNVTVTGTKFFEGSLDGAGVLGSVVTVNGDPVTTTYVSPTELSADIPSSYFLNAGCLDIAVNNAAPAGGSSNSEHITVGATAIVGTSATNTFDCQAPESLLPTPLGATSDPERVSWNGAGLADGRTAKVRETVQKEMPAVGRQYLELQANATSTGMTIPLGGPLPRPLNPADLVNEIQIPIPANTRFVGFYWDFYNRENAGATTHNDGMSIDVVDANGDRVANLVYADVTAPLSPNAAGGFKDTFEDGPQFFCAPLPAPCSGNWFLSVACWNGQDNSFPSRAVLDHVTFGGRDADFEVQPSCDTTAFGTTLSGFASTDPEFVSFNGATSNASRMPAADPNPTGLGMPSHGAQYLRLPGRSSSPQSVPLGGPFPRPNAGAVNEVAIPIPYGCRGIAFDWDFHDAELGNTANNDGVSIDVVDAAGNLILNLAYADTSSARAPSGGQDGATLCVASAMRPRDDVLEDGFQTVAAALPALPYGAYLSIVSWNGTNDLAPSHAVFDNLHFCESTAFGMHYQSHDGPGSLQIALANGTPGNTFHWIFTLNPGSFPNGWFLGLDPSFPELLPQLFATALPSFGTLSIEGEFPFELPGLSLPAGLPFYSVAVETTPAGTVTAVTPPVYHVTE